MIRDGARAAFTVRVRGWAVRASGVPSHHPKDDSLHEFRVVLVWTVCVARTLVCGPHVSFVRAHRHHARRFRDARNTANEYRRRVVERVPYYDPPKEDVYADSGADSLSLVRIETRVYMVCCFPA